MGKKRTRRGKYLYLLFAGLIFVSLSGCATLREMEGKRKARESLIRAQELLDQGDYEGFLKENQKVLFSYENIPPGDEAFFNMGLLYAHYRYPKKNYKKSLEFFVRLAKVFPQSPLAGQAEVWIGILEENERLKKEIEESNQAIKQSKQKSEGLSREIEELKQTIKEWRQVDIEIDEKRKEISK